MTLIRPCLLLGLILMAGVIASMGAPKPEPRIAFIENKNQFKKQVLFMGSTPGVDVFLLKNKIQFLVKQESTDIPKSRRQQVQKVYEGGDPHHRGAWMSSQLYEVSFIGGNEHPVMEAEDAAITSYNYFLGSDRSKWASKARGFGTVFYRQLYCNIDLKIYSENERMKQDWIVSPLGDPSEIKINYDGAESTHLKEGNLIISTKAGEVLELQPYAYQEINGCKVTVPCRYKLRRDVLSFELPDGYDDSQTLIIDPILVFSGYSGSTYDNWGNSATFDAHGNLYSGGMVRMIIAENNQIDPGHDFPATPGAYKTQFIGGDWDIGILKYDSSGSSLLYATYLGANGTESPQSLVVNSQGELLVLGATSSSNFPVTNGSVFKGGVSTDPIDGTVYEAGSDIFIAKLSEDGSKLISATYLGGASNDGLGVVSGGYMTFDKVISPLAKNYGDEVRGDIITDSQGNVYIASVTRSSDFPVVNTDANAQFNGGQFDAVLVKLKPDLSSILWSRLIGGSGADAAYSLKLDATNGVYIAGGTTSPDFKGMNGLHTSLQGDIDGWAAHFSPAGDQLINATYIGTTSYDQAYFIDLNSDAEIFLYGQTQGTYPVTTGVYSNPGGGQFLHKLSSDLTTSVFSTVIGSGGYSPNISPTAFLVSDCNTIYLGGWGGVINTYSYNYVQGNTIGLPVSSDAYQPTTSGNDFYFMVLAADASSFIYGTYFGGSGSYTHVDGGTSRFDKSGVVYHSVCAGCGGVSDFPAVNVPPARQKNRSSNCNNAAFKFDLSSLHARLQSNNLKLTSPGFDKVCLGDSIVFQNKSVGGELFQWDLGDGNIILKTDTTLIRHQYKTDGSYLVRLKAFNPGTCKAVDSASLKISVFKRNGFAGPGSAICYGSTASLNAYGGVKYNWTSKDTTFKASTTPVSVSPTDTANYYFVRIADVNGCVVKDTVKVTVVPLIPVDISIRRMVDCLDRPWVEVRNLTLSGDSTYIDFGDGTKSVNAMEIHHYKKDSVYTIGVVGKKDFCVYEKKEQINVYTIRAPNVITPEGTAGLNDTFDLSYGGMSIRESGVDVSLRIYNRWGKEIYHNADYLGDWRGDNVQAGVYFYEAVIDGATCKSWLQIIK